MRDSTPEKGTEASLTSRPELALRQQESLRAVVESISSELALRPLLTAIARHACELLDAWDGAIGLYQPSRERIRIEAVYRMPEDELGAEFGPGVGLAGQVLSRRQPVVFNSYRAVPQPTREDRNEFAVVGVPIEWRGQLIGFFGLGAAPPRTFGPQDVETLTLFARHAAIAIDNAKRYGNERERSRRWGLIARVGRLIASDLDLSELLQTAVDMIREVLGYEGVAISLIEPATPETLSLSASQGHFRHPRRRRQPLGEGQLGVAVQQQRAEVRDHGDAAPEEIAVPILLGQQALGGLYVESITALSSEDVESLQVIADYLAAAIANARLFHRAQHLAILEERHRIARDLHDSVSQMIFSMSLQAQSLASAWRRDPKEGEEMAQRLVLTSQKAQTEMRALLKELRPAAEEDVEGSSRELALAALYRLRRLGLTAALEEHLEEISQFGFQVALEAGSYQPQDDEVEEALFRIAQEALHNVTKHSRAKQVHVTLELRSGQVLLQVIDDGVGLDDKTSPSEGSGLGLYSMRERAASLGGSCKILSLPASGTAVRVQVPIRPAAP